MEKLTEILKLINEDDQLIIQKDGSGRLDRIIDNDLYTYSFFDNINDLLIDLKNN